MFFVVFSLYTVSGSDFKEYSESVRFNPCERRKCVDIEIIDDCELEDTETFIVTLLRNGLPNDILVGNSQTTITITDSDGKTAMVVAITQCL